MQHKTLLVALVGLLGTTGCETIEVVRDEYRGDTPHEQYLAGLHAAGLAGTALSQAWITEAAKAIRNPVDVDLPILDEGWFSADDPTAIGYRFPASRGRHITVTIEIDPEEPGRVFVDLLRVAEDSTHPPRPVEADTLPGGGLRYEVRRDGVFIVRIQPELLHSGAYRLTLGENPALAFPVAGHGMRAIQSAFGAPRDGGRREHHGVDIFARRGTPVVASIAGRVRRVEVTNLGGKVVWLGDEKIRRSLYYAHLDSQTVSNGDRVEVGDTLGFVGNTGNARTTPPHLHFGVYARGPSDPDPYLRPNPRRLAALEVNPEMWGRWVRTESDGIRLRAGPSTRSEERAVLSTSTPLRVIGGSGRWYRVEAPDGQVGYIAARLTEAVDAPLSRVTMRAGAELRSRPLGDAPPRVRAESDAEVALLGRTAGFAWVRAPSGLAGWVADEDLRGDRQKGVETPF
ncbi:MAG: peptidoglycan DD-metalloendopeptidase family protein [Longimicrobiales bacterium]|nr:peptidoglycan DD-metalloendopeptidase family protein [Longimicrobiales bacterium]